MSFLAISQEVATYPYQEPSYDRLIDTFQQFLTCLKANKQTKESSQYRAIKGLFWDLAMRIASENQFIERNN